MLFYRYIIDNGSDFFPLFAFYEMQKLNHQRKKRQSATFSDCYRRTRSRVFLIYADLLLRLFTAVRHALLALGTLLIRKHTRIDCDFWGVIIQQQCSHLICSTKRTCLNQSYRERKDRASGIVSTQYMDSTTRTGTEFDPSLWHTFIYVLQQFDLFQTLGSIKSHSRWISKHHVHNRTVDHMIRNTQLRMLYTYTKQMFCRWKETCILHSIF